MAEIKIEKRKPAWPWIIAGLAVIAIIVFLVVGNNDRDMNRDQTAAYGSKHDSRYDKDRDNTRNNSIMNGNSDKKERREVAEFVDYVRHDLKDETLDHRNLTRAFNELRDATESIAEKTGYPKENIEDTKDYIKEINKDSFEDENAEQIKRTADVFADHLQKMQMAKFPQLKTDAMKLVETSKRIHSNQPAVDQTGELRSFLAEAADLVEKME